MSRYRARIQYIYQSWREIEFEFETPYAVSERELFTTAREHAPPDSTADDIDVLEVKPLTGELTA